MSLEIRKAERYKSKLRLALAGPSGAGKTMSALKLAKGIGGKVLMIDTERGSGDLYADLFDYDIITMEAPFKPQSYIDAIDKGVAAGYTTIVIDSLSHAWSDDGGLLDQADKMEASGKNRFTMWAELTPQHRKLVAAMLNAPCHIIATVRSKQEYVLEKDDKTGKNRVRKMGMGIVQRDGLEYEFTVFFDVDQNHNAHASKDRTNLFKDEVFVIDEKISERITKWLNVGIERPAAVDPIVAVKGKILHCLKLLEADVSTPEATRASIKLLTGLDGTEVANADAILTKLELTVKERTTEPWKKPIAAEAAPAKVEETTAAPAATTHGE